MVRRILVCMEEQGVAQVVAARLLRDGTQAVVVEKPGDLIDHAEAGVGAVRVPPFIEHFRGGTGGEQEQAHGQTG